MPALIDLYTDRLHIGLSAQQRLPFLQRAAQSGDGPSCYNMAISHLQSGRFREGLSWLSQAAEKGLGVAHVLLGNCFRDGRGVRADPQKALHHYQEAIKVRSKEIDDVLFINIDTVFLFQCDPSDADALSALAEHMRSLNPMDLSWLAILDRAGNAGSSEAFLTLADYYLEGQSGKVDEKLGLDYVDKASAMVRCITLCDSFRGTKNKIIAGRSTCFGCTRSIRNATRATRCCSFIVYQSCTCRTCSRDDVCCHVVYGCLTWGV
jgi:TPR repeat protein